MDKWKILVIAQLDQIGGIISKILNGKGFDANVVDTSGRVEETYSKIRAELSRREYDLVLLTNYGLRPIDIQALIPEIKKKHPAIKIIVLSGLSTPEFVRDLKEQGIDDFLSLPFAHDDVVQKVTSIFDQEYKIKEEEEIEEEEDEGNSYGRKMPIRQVLLELERDGIIQFYEDRWGKVQFRITGGWS